MAQIVNEIAKTEKEKKDVDEKINGLDQETPKMTKQLKITKGR